MLGFKNWIDYGLETFRSITETLSGGDPAIKTAVAVVLAGVLGLMFRRVVLRLPKELYTYIRRKLICSVTILNDESSDRVNYIRFMKFYGEKTVGRGSRSLRLHFEKSRSVLAAGNGRHWFFYKNWYYWFIVKDLPSESGQQKSSLTIYTFGFSNARIESLVDAFKFVPNGKLAHFVPDNRNSAGTRFSSYIVPLDFDSVIVDPKTMEMLKSRLNWFLENEQWYRDRDLDYKLIIMLYGPPGTGKSYLTRAIACYIKRNIVTISMESDHSFERGVIGLTGNDIGLIEDFDDNKAMLKRSLAEGEDFSHEVRVRKDGASLSVVLNALQGVSTSNGKVVVMSTNHLEVIDPALYRKGRVDLLLEVLPLKHPEIIRYISKMYSPEDAASAAGSFTFKPVPASVLGGLFKEEPQDVQAFLKSLTGHPTQL